MALFLIHLFFTSPLTKSNDIRYSSRFSWWQMAELGVWAVGKESVWFNQYAQDFMGLLTIVLDDC